MSEKPRITNHQMQHASGNIGHMKAAMDTSHNLSTYCVGLLDAVAMIEKFETDVRTDNQENLAKLPFPLATKPDVATIVMLKNLVDAMAQRYSAAVPIYEQIESTPNGQEDKPKGVTEH